MIASGGRSNRACVSHALRIGTEILMRLSSPLNSVRRAVVIGMAACLIMTLLVPAFALNAFLHALLDFSQLRSTLVSELGSRLVTNRLGVPE